MYNAERRCCSMTNVRLDVYNHKESYGVRSITTYLIYPVSYVSQQCVHKMAVAHG